MTQTPTRKWLYEHYEIQGLGVRAIAKKLGCGKNTACKLLHAHGINVRPPNAISRKSRPYRGPRIPLQVCEVCGISYKPHTFERARKSRTHSKQCHGILRQTDPVLRQASIDNLPRNVAGEKNGNWRGGTSNKPYPFAFDEALKIQIRERDNHTCQLCGTTQEEQKLTLNIHHLDYNKANIEHSNLITLCRSCNAKVNGNRSHWQSHFETKIQQIYSGAET